MALGVKDLSTGLPGNLSNNVGNSLGPNLPAVPSVSGTPNFSSTPVPEGEDPCSSLTYLKNKLSTMPLIGDLSLTDISGAINLDALTAPKIPTLGELAEDVTTGISDGISSVLNDVKDGVTDIMEGLKPSNLIPNIKKEIGAAGRVALAGALEDAMLDALGPVKGGVGDRIKRSVKTNLMMAGIEEVVNILEGKPNILNPCPGEDELASNSAKEASRAETGKMNMAMNKAIAEETKSAASSSNKMARDLPPPVKKPTIPALKTGLPGVGTLPEIPGDDPAVYEADVKKHEVAVEKVADKATKQVAKSQSETGAKNEEKKQTRDEKKQNGLPASGDNFKPVVAPGSVFKFFAAEHLSGVTYESDTNDIIGSLNTAVSTSKSMITGKQTLDQIKTQQQKKLCTVHEEYFIRITGEIHELKQRDFVKFDTAGVPETFYSGWLSLELLSSGMKDPENDECATSPVVLSRSDTTARNKNNQLEEQEDEEAFAFGARYPSFLMNGNRWTAWQLFDNAKNMSFYNHDVLQLSGLAQGPFGTDLYAVPIYWNSYEDAVSDLFEIVTNPELIDLMFDIQHFNNK